MSDLALYHISQAKQAVYHTFTLKERHHFVLLVHVVQETLVGGTGKYFLNPALIFLSCFFYFSLSFFFFYYMQEINTFLCALLLKFA